MSLAEELVETWGIGKGIGKAVEHGAKFAKKGKRTTKIKKGVKIPRTRNVKKIEKRLKDEDWEQFVPNKGQRKGGGSHKYFKHPDNEGIKITLPTNEKEIKAPKTLKKIYADAGWEW